MKRNPLPMREQLNRVVPSGSAEDGARGSAPYMGQGTSPLWVGRAKPCPCGALNDFRLAKSSIELPVLAEQNWKDLGACHPEPPPSVARLTAISLAVRQREQAFVLPPCGVSVGRSIPSRSGSIFFGSAVALYPKKISTLCLDFILAFWQSAFSIFPFTAFTKCALILNKKLSVRPTGFLQNSNLSKQGEV